MDFATWLEQSWVYIAAAFAGLTILVNGVKNVKNIVDDIKKPLKDVNDKLDKLEASTNTNSKKLEELAPKINATSEHVASIEQTLAIQNDALLGLEKSGLLDNCEKAIKQGYADRNHRNMIEKQYNSYVALGDGSEFVKDLVETVKGLPFEKPKAKKQQLNG